MQNFLQFYFRFSSNNVLFSEMTLVLAKYDQFDRQNVAMQNNPKAHKKFIGCRKLLYFHPLRMLFI